MKLYTSISEQWGEPHFSLQISIDSHRLYACVFVCILKHINYIQTQVCDLHVDSDSTVVKWLLYLVRWNAIF